MPYLITPRAFDFEGYQKRAEEKVARRKDELAKCTNNAEEIALKQVWALEDLPEKMPRPEVHNHHDSSGGGIGLLGLFGLLG